MFKQLTTAAAVLAFAGMSQAGTIQFDFDSLLGEVTSGDAADFGTDDFAGTLTITDTDDTILLDILDGTTALGVGPVAPADFTMTVDLDGTEVTGGSLSFSDGVESFDASIVAGGSLLFGPGSTFFITNLITGPVGQLDLFGVLFEFDGTGNTFTFDGIPTSIRDGSSEVEVNVFATGNVVPTPTAAAAGFMALGLLAARRRQA
ncbi:MAG: hypothetical protein AAF586_10295 [Planctomycetota bacterium]